MAELLLLEHRYFGQRALVEVKRILFKRPVNRKSALGQLLCTPVVTNRTGFAEGLAQSACYRD
jgi:hypothetical protein